MRSLLERLEFVIRPTVVAPSDFTELEGHPLAEMDSSRVEHYVQAGASGRGCVVTVGEAHAVLDGRHRIAAARRAGEASAVLNIPQAAYERLAGDGGLPAMSLEEIAQYVIERYQEKRGRLD